MKNISEKEAIDIAKSFMESNPNVGNVRLNHAFLTHEYEDDTYWLVDFLYLDEEGNIVTTIDPSSISVFVSCSTGEASLGHNI